MIASTIVLLLQALSNNLHAYNTLNIDGAY